MPHNQKHYSTYYLRKNIIIILIIRACAYYLLFLAGCFYIKIRVKRIEVLGIQPVGHEAESFSETLEMHDFPFSQEAQWREHIGVIRQVDEIFVGAARFLLCCDGVSAKKKAGESKDSLAFLNFAIIRW